MLLTDGVNNIKKIFTNCMVLLLPKSKEALSLLFNVGIRDQMRMQRFRERERLGREDNERLNVQTFLQRLWSEEMVWETILMLTDT